MLRKRRMHGRKVENKKDCDCLKSHKLQNFVARAGCAEDDAAVAALPEQWVPKHGGPILNNYLRERKQNHEKVYKDIMDGAAAVNCGVGYKIKANAQLLLACIEQNQKDIDCVLEHCNISEGILPIDSRREPLKRIYQLHSQRVEDMSTFSREAVTLERERADGLRILLRDKFQLLIAVGHQPPKDLLHDFDERIYEINQQLLSNSRAYSELEAQLRVQADESVVHARSTINQLCLGVGIASRGRSAIPRVREIKSSQYRSASASGAGKRDSSQPPKGRILTEVEVIEECVARLVEAYRTAVLKVCTGFSGKLSSLERDLGSHHCFLDAETHTCETADLQLSIEKTLQRLLNSVHKNNASPGLLEVTGHEIMSVQKSLWSLGESLRDTYTTLHDAGHLWDAHMLRSALAQKLTIAAVEDLLTSNDIIELANEVPFNIALEQLRGSSDPEKLQQQYHAIMVMLNRTAEMYLHHSEAELGRLEEFMNLHSSMANMLLAEFNCFLEKYPRPLQSPASAFSQLGFGSRNVIVHRSPLSRAILQTEHQEAALRNWRNGFLESYERNVSLVPDELKHQAQLWTEERAGALHMRYSLKLVSHSIREERVKAARHARLAELRHHEARLDSHLDAVYDLVDRLPLEAAEFASLEAPNLYPFCRWIDSIQRDVLLAQDSLEPEQRMLKMSSYASRLLKHRNLFEESLQAAVDMYKRQLEHNVQEARISNVRFMSQVRVFNEGGRYAAQEATWTCSSLVRAADALESSVGRSIDALNHRRNQLLALADQKLLPLQRLVEEILKAGGKGGQDKRKPPLGKKK